MMEFVEGGSLRDLLSRDVCGLPVNEALTLIVQVASGLSAAHAKGVIHRDMKPENVLIDPAGTARVTDFGLALPLHEASARLTLTGTTVGTVDYMAPEQLKGGDLDVRTDLFALGVIAYELLTGLTPRGSFDPPQRVRADEPASVSEAVMKALRPQPTERFDSVDAFVEALHAPPIAIRQSKTWLPWALGVAGLVIALAIAPFSPEATVEAVPTAPPVLAAPPPPAIAAEPALPLYEFGPWRDALATVDVQRDAINGEWSREGTSVVSTNGICILELQRNDMPISYDLRTSFTRLSGADSVAVFAWINASVGSCEFDAWQLGLSGLQLIQGVSLEHGESFRFPLENGRRYELLLEIRPAYVRFIVDGVELKTYRLGDHEHCWPPFPWGWPQDRQETRLGLGSYKSPTRFDKVEWRAARLAAR